MNTSNENLETDDSTTEAYGEPLEEILEQIPKWFHQWGTSIIFIVLTVVVAMSFVIKYPDVIESEAYITSSNPPISLIAKADGVLINLRKKTNEPVQRNEVLALLDNSVNYNDIKELKKQLENKAVLEVNPPNALQLGSILQPVYNEFRKAQREYIQYINLDPHIREIATIDDQIKGLQKQLINQRKQAQIFENELSIIGKKYQRTLELFESNVIAAQDMENQEKELLENKRLLEGFREKIAITDVSINKLIQEKDRLLTNKDQQLFELNLKMINAYDNLQSTLSSWEQDFLVTSPIDGNITFFEHWAENQSVSKGDELFSIIPKGRNEVVAKLQMPIRNSGKVKVGDKVLIKLNNYPYTEFGSLQGEIKTVSLTPKDGFYFLSVALSNELVTSSGFELPFRPNMEGRAEIITDDLVLADRLLFRLKNVSNDIL